MFSVEGWTILRPALRLGPIDLHVPSGATWTVMGPSGVGKSSFLLSVLGYQSADLITTGSRSAFGRSLSVGETPLDSVYIPQGLPFNPNWEVEAYLCRLPWGSTSAIDSLLPRNQQRVARVRAVLDQLEIGHRSSATVAGLSGGEAQRAAIAQILLARPRIIVADEFVSALDHGIADQMLIACQQVTQERSGIGLYALHDIRSALLVSDRILVLWPYSVLQSPWQIAPQSWLWHVENLHALLCFARRVMPSSYCSETSSHLVRLLQRLLLGDGNKQPRLEIPMKGEAHVVDRNGVCGTAPPAVYRSIREMISCLGPNRLRYVELEAESGDHAGIAFCLATGESGALLLCRGHRG